jgi:hypothetical protein
MVIARGAIEDYLGDIEPAPRFKGAGLRQIEDAIANYSVPYRPTSLQEPAWRHQLEGLAFSLWAEQALIFYWMRIGKSRISLEWAMQLRDCGKWRGQGLIIAHAPIGLQVWQEQIEKYTDFSAAYVQNDIDEFLDALDGDYDLIVTPWSGLQVMFTKRVTRKRKNGEVISQHVPRLQLLEKAARLFDLCIMDEIHMCKNHKSLRFQNAAALTQYCTFRLGLTGTPFGRSGFALWAEAFLIDRGRTLGDSYNFFEQAFGNEVKNDFKWGGKEFKFDKKKLPLLREKMAPIMLSYELSEVRQTDVRPGVVRLRMTGDQAQTYAEIVTDLIRLKNSERIEIQNQFLRLRQVASGYLPFTDEDGESHLIHFDSNAKMEWLTAFLDDQWDGNAPIVIFVEFTETGKMISAELAKRHIAHGWFYGGTKNPDEVLAAFQQGRTKVFVANTAKGGAAIDLSVADYLIFYECPVTPIARAQAEARPLAASRGMRKLLVDDLVTAPIEERILGFIREGKDALASLMGSRAALGLASPSVAAPRKAAGGVKAAAGSREPGRARRRVAAS